MCGGGLPPGGWRVTEGFLGSLCGGVLPPPQMVGLAVKMASVADTALNHHLLAHPFLLDGWKVM